MCLALEQGRINYISDLSLALRNSTRVLSQLIEVQGRKNQKEDCEGQSFCSFTLFDYIQILL